MNKYSYDWALTDLAKVEKNGYKVFSCFACGGGSTMGYKLAGYDVIGCNELDKRLMKVYQYNHNPKYSYCEDIRAFIERNNLPEELYDLDILDGSPPCSSFSMAGSREKGWGKAKKFKEGQALQTLDDLPFEFIKLANKLKPKIVILENVKGLLVGRARKYLQEIIYKLECCGYATEKWLLDAKYMGVPQARERVFIIAIRHDIANRIVSPRLNLLSNMPYINLTFKEGLITYKEVEGGKCNENENAWHIPPSAKKYWLLTKPGNVLSTVHPKGSYFNVNKLAHDKVVPTLRAATNDYYHYKEERRLFTSEIIKISTFPHDYQFLNMQPIYVCGMSVPPVMIAQIATRIKQDWLDKIT